METKQNQTKWTPQRKIGAGIGIGGPLAVLIAWVLSLNGIAMPAEASAALGAVLTAVVGYFVPQ